MAAILIDRSGDKVRPPHLPETVDGIGFGDAIVSCVDEADFSVSGHPHVMGIQRSGEVGRPRHKAVREQFVHHLICPQDVLHPVDIGKCGHEQGLAVIVQTHGFLEELLVHHQPALGVTPQKIEPAGLVGGHGDGNVELVQKRHEAG